MRIGTSFPLFGRVRGFVSTNTRRRVVRQRQYRGHPILRLLFWVLVIALLLVTFPLLAVILILLAAFRWAVR